ncbi:MAG: DoxX family membrane protein [Aquificales bacterium]|nr:DoxX family membrane protein [Aquificales bacterium]
MTTLEGSTTSSNSNALAAVGQYAHWVLRIAIAGVFVYHGLTKFADLSGGAAMMGMPVALWASVAAMETLGGILILVGGFTKDIVTRIGGLLIIPPMLGAIAMVHWGQWSFVPSEAYPMGGMEFQSVMLLLGVYFALRGNGDSA